MGQDARKSSEKSAGNVRDDGEIPMAHADASVVEKIVEDLEARPKVPVIPLSEIALTGIYEISKILNAPNRLETTLASVLNVLSSFLQMRHGVISLLADDDVPDITVGIGWNEGTDERYRARLPETAIGQIVATAVPKTSPRIHCSRPTR
jgi:transcriptional regulator with GAF, ATPase, and Fis domain